MVGMRGVKGSNPGGAKSKILLLLEKFGSSLTSDIKKHGSISVRVNNIFIVDFLVDHIAHSTKSGANSLFSILWSTNTLSSI